MLQKNAGRGELGQDCLLSHAVRFIIHFLPLILFYTAVALCFSHRGQININGKKFFSGFQLINGE
jgi:hypothetical protein